MPINRGQFCFPCIQEVYIGLKEDRGLGADDMHTKDVFGLFVDHQFDESIVLITRIKAQSEAFGS